MKPKLDVPRSAVTADSGLLIVDKPAGVTSHDVVGAVRRLAATRKVGHAGTLDPMATGVLILGIGKGTRLLTHLVGTEKAYRATVELGLSTDTDDADGQVISAPGIESFIDPVGAADRQVMSAPGIDSCSKSPQDDLESAANAAPLDLESAASPAPNDLEEAASPAPGDPEVTAHRAPGDLEVTPNPAPGDFASLEAAIEAAMSDLRGDIMQVPATVSALKIDGKRAYARHRAGEDVELPARPVHIARLERICDVEIAQRTVKGRVVTVCRFDVDVECSSGTYVRSLARDMGQALGVGGYLTALRRTRVGSWTEADAVTVDTLCDHVNAQGVENAAPIPVLSLTRACEHQFAILHLTRAEAVALQFGNVTKLRPRTPDGQIAACLWDGQVRALVRREGQKYRPLAVLNTDPVDSEMR